MQVKGAGLDRFDLAILDDGSIVAVGYSDNGGDFDVAMVRLGFALI